MSQTMGVSFKKRSGLVYSLKENLLHSVSKS